MLDHLNTFGEDLESPTSLVCFHYSMLDFFSSMPRKVLEGEVAAGIDECCDWTFDQFIQSDISEKKWQSLFGEADKRIEEVLDWLKILERHQLCAVCVVGINLGSVNIAYIVATQIEDKDLERFIEQAYDLHPYGYDNEVLPVLKNFLYYFRLSPEVVCVDAVPAVDLQADRGEADCSLLKERAEWLQECQELLSRSEVQAAILPMAREILKHQEGDVLYVVAGPDTFKLTFLKRVEVNTLIASCPEYQRAAVMEKLYYYDELKEVPILLIDERHIKWAAMAINVQMLELSVGMTQEKEKN